MLLARTQSEIIELAQIFRARVVDIGDDTLTLEDSGDPGKMVAIVQVLNKFRIRKLLVLENCPDAGVLG